ncbi:hypothetical protein PUMCH_001108 [Australozyma saopauloensis]|uniref:RNA helicase n=1 Tax=Australozyma saopauloensis TaxID=291208 RepID=A0AAX4H5Q8_9ASCO|nr:hypothetical protein PUMCH_001108 [[Candida] saopauloensis]
MSEAALESAKAEKLRKRQEQLAKWKSKKASTPSDDLALPISKDGSNIDNAVDEKKLERLKKLEEWKKKRQQADQLGSSSIQLQEKQNLRLEAWKKKRSEQSNFKATLIPKFPQRTVKKARPHSTSSSLFDETENTTEKLLFKKPTLSRSNDSESHSLDESPEDSLDAYLDSLQTETTEVNQSPMIVEAEDSEPENLGEDEDQKLISSKMKSLQKEKALLVVDHSQVDYIPFRKNFYEEPDAIKNLMPEDIALLRLSMDGIKVSGSNVPSPIWDWDQLGLSSLVVSILKEELRFETPTSIQSQALPSIMSGRDFLGIAKTGSGKTLGFILPLLRHVQDQPPLEDGDGPIGILLTPTRELALQIYKVLSVFAKKLSISTACCYGGSSIEPQIADLKKGSQIVVATPGRLIDLLAANGGRVCNLRRVTYVVLDEADRMFDFGFEPQVNKIFSQIRPDRQSILFSATFAKKMESLAKAILVDPVEIIVGGISVVPPEITQRVEFIGLEGHESEEEISSMKLQLLISTLLKFPDVKKLVFVEKQDSADKLLVKLLANSFACVAIHGGKEQIDRKYAIKEFSDPNSGVDIMLATSIAARGLDVKGLDLVVNYDPANHMEDYVHRVGRTGRAGLSGHAYTLVTLKQERSITDLVKALRLSKIPDSEIDDRLLSIANAFLDKVKQGKEKYRFGFGGEGLSKLDQVRKSNQVMERRAYDVANDGNLVTPVPSTVDTPNKEREAGLDLPEFTIIEGKAEESSGPDKCKFHSRITINDLPQKARWIVVNRESLAQIIESTATSITNKGQYYPPNTKVPTTIKQGGKEVPAPPKLYLLIEGLTQMAVKEANRLIRQKMIEGLEQAGLEDNLTAPMGKYTV